VANEEAKCHLARLGAVIGRDCRQYLPGRRMRIGEAAMAERAVGDGRHAVLLAPGQHRMLDRALLQIVEDLIARDPALTARAPRRLRSGTSKLLTPQDRIFPCSQNLPDCGCPQP
jgi:hypothetical protein